MDNYMNIGAPSYAMLGYANIIQDSMEPYCAAVDKGINLVADDVDISLELTKVPNAMKEWQLLLQIDADEKRTGMS